MAGNLYRVEVLDNQLVVLLNTAKLNLDAQQLAYMGGAIRDATERVRARAVRNVSGYPVRYDGQAFRVMVRTGALKGAIDHQYPYQSVLQGRVFVDGTHTATGMTLGERVVKPRPVSTYAAAIEYGHKEIDLKKFMQGKVVPFFASRSANSTGPYSVRGLTPVDGTGERMWENTALNNRLQAAGKNPMHFERHKAAAYAGHGGGSYFISFRRVGKTGWIIPAARQRPFMRAALRQSERDMRSLTFNRLTDLLRDPHPG